MAPTLRLEIPLRFLTKLHGLWITWLSFEQHHVSTDTKTRRAVSPPATRARDASMPKPVKVGSLQFGNACSKQKHNLSSVRPPKPKEMMDLLQLVLYTAIHLRKHVLLLENGIPLAFRYYYFQTLVICSISSKSFEVLISYRHFF